MISIIIPVYQIEESIERCVNSIVAQSYTDWELILVNDGSKDHSGEICDKLSTTDPRIHVVHKQNGGVSSARNVGINAAKGEWIVFVDGDDVIGIDYLRQISQNSDYDFIVFGMAIDKYHPNGILAESYSKLISDTYIIDIKDLPNSFACIFRSLNMDSSCCKAFRKSIIDRNNLRFNVQMVCYEDFEFVIRYLECCKGSFCSLPYIAYHYIQQIDYNPILRRNNIDLSPSVYILLDNLYKWVKPERLEGYNKDSYFYIIASKFGLILNQIKTKRYTENINIFHTIHQNKLFVTYQNEIISHSRFFMKIVLKLIKMKFNTLAYFVNKVRN